MVLTGFFLLALVKALLSLAGMARQEPADVTLVTLVDVALVSSVEVAPETSLGEALVSPSTALATSVWMAPGMEMTQVWR